MIKSGKNIKMNADIMEIKSEELGGIASSIAEEVEQIDESMKMIVVNGLLGSSVDEMAEKYLTSRKAISSIVKEIAALSIKVKKDAEAMREVDVRARG